VGAGLNPIVIWLRLLSIRVGVTLSLFSVCPLVPEEGLLPDGRPPRIRKQATRNNADASRP
jgi:hypothetical protein